MQFLAPTNIFEGAVQLNSAPSADNHAVTKAYLEANSVVGIASDSANYAELVTEGGDLKLKLKPLTITDVSVDTSATSLANWIASNYTSGDEKQEGDIIILTNVSGRAQTFIHDGGTAGDATDWAEIEGQDISAAEGRGFISASSGIDYNSATGAITADQGEIRGFFSAGSGLSYDASNGIYSLNVNSDGISEGSSNLYFTNARAQAAISANPAAGNMATVSSGQVLVAKSSFRSTFAPQNLTANTFATLNHGLGEKIVHVSAYDSSGNLVQLDVQLVDANNVKVKSVINVSCAEIVVSL